MVLSFVGVVIQGVGEVSMWGSGLFWATFV